jgi:hypothetical protein
MKTKELKSLQAELLPKVQREYQEGWNHINTWRSRVQEEVTTFKDNSKKDFKIDLVKENMDFERATFLLDDIDVDFVTEDGVIANKQIKNKKQVYKFDFIDTNRKDMLDAIIIENVNYGIAVEVMDMFDEDENQPMSVLINPDACIPDPKCSSGSGMRFFGFSRKMLSYKLDNDNYDLQWLEVEEMSEDSNLKISNQARTENTQITSNDGFVDIYEHYTMHNGKKWLTTWVNERSTMIRAVELTQMTKSEELNPMKCKYPVIFHRRKPYPYRWAGYRMMEEVGTEQDIVTELKKLELAQARISAHWPDMYINAGLGVEQGKLAKLKAGGRIIPVDLPDWQNISQQLYQSNYSPNTNTSSVYAEWMLNRVQRNTGYTDITMGVSPDGGQTKGEIQQLQANANKFIAWVSSNYMDGQKEYAYLWDRMYTENMPAKGKKIIALFDKGGLARTLKRSDFVSDWKIIISVTSANQQRIVNEKAVTKLLALSQTIIPTLKSEHAVNTFTRTLVDKSGIEGVDGEELIPLTYDEQLALSRVEIINNYNEHKQLIQSTPEPGEDLDTHINIYEKCLDNACRKDILDKYNQARLRKKEMMPTQEVQSDGQGSNMAMNLLAWQNNPNTTPMQTL